MLKRYATWFGIILLVVGILGYLPPLTPDGRLLGLFAVDSLHNIVHLLTGALALWAGLTSVRYSRIYFQTFGVIYAIVALAGFFYGSRPLFGMMANNIADAWLHVLIAVVALYLGFVYGLRHVTGTHGPRVAGGPPHP